MLHHKDQYCIHMLWIQLWFRFIKHMYISRAHFSLFLMFDIKCITIGSTRRVSLSSLMGDSHRYSLSWRKLMHSKPLFVMMGEFENLNICRKTTISVAELISINEYILWLVKVFMLTRTLGKTLWACMNLCVTGLGPCLGDCVPDSVDQCHYLLSSSQRPR